MSQANRHLMMLVPGRDWEMCSGLGVGSVQAPLVCRASDPSPGLPAKGIAGEVAEGRDLAASAPTALSLGGLG